MIRELYTLFIIFILILGESPGINILKLASDTSERQAGAEGLGNIGHDDMERTVRHQSVRNII